MVSLEDNRIEQFDKIVKSIKEARKDLIDYWIDIPYTLPSNTGW
jgi:hypothetical protein